MTAGLYARQLCLAIGGKTLLDKVDIAILPGRVTAVVGPNGAGKSTLLKVLSGDLTPNSGSLTLNGVPMSQWNARERALQRAVLPQTPELAFAFRPRDVVEMGRHPHRGRVAAAQDRLAIAGAMQDTETLVLADRDCRSLSGGELHRVHFARALAQIWAPLQGGRTRVLLLDEPTAALDLFHQHAVLAKARALADQGVAVFAVLHDLNLAAAYADTIAVLSAGAIDACGSPGEVLTPDRVGRIWRVECQVMDDEDGLRVMVKKRSAQRT